MLYKNPIVLTLGAAWVLFSLPAQAEDANLTNSIPSDPIRAEAVLPSVLVTGTMETAAQRAATVERESVNAIVVIDAEQLVQFGEQSLGDALRRIPGVTFKGANRAREVRLRGLPDQYTQVLINGRRLLDGNSRRTVEVDRFPTGLVERIEVTRAPRATLDGQGAAGTVNIVLKNGATLPTEVTVGGGYLEDNGSQGELGLVTGGRLGCSTMGWRSMRSAFGAPKARTVSILMAPASPRAQNFRSTNAGSINTHWRPPSRCTSAKPRDCNWSLFICAPRKTGTTFVRRWRLT